MLKLPPPVWALAYLVVAAAVSYLAGWPRMAGLPAVPLGIMLVIAGVALSATAAALFHREGTQLKPTSTTNHRLVTSGPFRFTRNPMYLGLVLITYVGIAFWVRVTMFLAPVAIFVTVNVFHIPFEEAKMRRQFGAEFDAYMSKVRRWL